jgi:hypothetical protein
MTRRLLAALLLLIAGLSPVFAQSQPGWTYGYVPTTAQWNTIFASKQDYAGAPPCLSTGCTMTGELATAASTTATSGLNVGIGVNPTSPQTGDVWLTATGGWFRIGSVTYSAALTAQPVFYPAAPTVASGFCTSPTISAPNGTAAFTLTIGTGCAGGVGVLTMPTTATGWVCHFNDLTTPANVPVQTSSGVTQVGITNYARNTGATQNFTNSDVINAQCTAF